ncbi:unnamed protein product [Brassica napus]|uniref:(rape) hypothetical protein n=1 Tax=Brassica napus TaxID=3708 RepID=A0A816UTU2_BRANA|nr:unnamed protein product [Brassica napus]
MKLDSKVFIFLKRNKRSDRRGEERGRNRGWFLYGEDCRVLRVTMRRKKSVSLCPLPTCRRPTVLPIIGLGSIRFSPY